MPMPDSFDPLRLKQFIPFANLDEHHLLLVANQINYQQAPAGYCLFEAGDIDSNEFFLLNGEVELTAHDGSSRRLDSRNEQAARQLSRLRPRQYTAVTTGESELIIIDADMIEELQNEALKARDTGGSYFVDEVGSLEEAEAQELLKDFKSALRCNRFVLPSLPEVAHKVRHLLDDEDASAGQIASVVNADPAIAAKLIRAANSPVYHGSSACDTTQTAIVRLGLNTTRQLVISFALKDLFHSRSGPLKKAMRQAWQNSVEVAAISLVVARKSVGLGYPAEEVMLAGLLHNIGMIAVLSYLDSHQGAVKDEVDIMATLEQLKAEAGELILRQWRFPEEFIVTVKDVNRWDRQHSGKADICDVVQVAYLHNQIRHKRPLPVAKIDQLPAFSKLPLGELTPQLSIKILDESREQIAEAQQLLNQ